MMVTETESNGQKSTHHEHHDQHQQGSEEKGRRHPRWTREETLSLIQAKEITENSPHRGRKMSSTSSSSLLGPENAEPKWVMISAHCRQKGVNRGPAQCRKRWSNLIGDYKKVKVWEDNLTDNARESFWAMRNDMRKEKKLPVSFDREVYRVLEAREVGPPGLALSPLPLRAVSASRVYEGGEKEEEDMEVEEVEEDLEPESEPEPEPEPQHGPEPEAEPKLTETANNGHGVEIEDLLVSESRGEGEEEAVLGWKLEEEKIVTDNVTDSPVKEFCSPEPISEQHHQAFQNQKTYTSQATGALRESWPGISYWDSQVRGKKRRISTDGNQANEKEGAQIIRVLETNNKMLHDQLDAHSKNCQLDREQRKESNDALVAALDKLTEAIVKIAEKL